MPQRYLEHFLVMLPDAWPLEVAPAEVAHLVAHIARAGGSSMVQGQRPLWRPAQHGVISKEGCMEVVRVGGGGGSLTSAMHGGGRSGGRLGGGQVEVVHSAGEVQHGGVVACL